MATQSWLTSEAVSFTLSILKVRQISTVPSKYTKCLLNLENHERETAWQTANSEFAGILVSCAYYALALEAVKSPLWGTLHLEGPKLLASIIHDEPSVQVILAILFNSYKYACYAANGFLVIFTTIAGVFAFIQDIDELG